MEKTFYIFQGFVTENPFNEEAPGPRFVILTLLKHLLMDPDMENIPTDYVNGTDFRITKTTKSDSMQIIQHVWVRKESALDEIQLAAV